MKNIRELSSDRETIFAALDCFTTSLHAALNAWNRMAKALLIAWFEFRSNEAQAKQLTVPHNSTGRRKMTTDELAQVYNVKPGTVREWVRKGMPKVPGGRKHLFQLEAVEQWLSGNAKVIAKKRQS